MKNVINRYFRLPENNTDIHTEFVAGLTTFLTMAYIVVVQPLVLSGRMFGAPTGMDFDSLFTATCLSAALATLIMGLYARYPIAQAPGMGENFFFVFSLLPATAAAGIANGWQTALGVILISGILFLILSLLGIREMIVNAISPSMKNAMAAGIGLFIAFIGLQNASLIVTSATVIPGSPPSLNPGTLVKLNADFFSPDLVVFFFGLMLTSALHVRRVKGSILLGILGSALFSLLLRFTASSMPAEQMPAWLAGSKLMTEFVPAGGIVAQPPSVAPTFWKMDVTQALSLSMIPFIVIFLFMDVFDTIGTLIGVSEQAGFIKDNKLPRARQAMLSDAVGTVAGACLGTTTVTSFVESAAGVEQGGRTGLTAVFAATLFILALFFSPIVQMIGSYAPITAPALVIVGAMMIRNISKIEWKDYSESIPAFLTVIGIPLSYSIADGLALGFISYPIVKFFGGKGREVKWLMYLLAAILVLYFLAVRVRVE